MFSIHLDIVQVEALISLMKRMSSYIRSTNKFPKKASDRMVVHWLVYALGTRDAEHISSQLLIEGMKIDLSSTISKYVQFYRSRYDITTVEWSESRLCKMIMRSFKQLRKDVSKLDDVPVSVMKTCTGLELHLGDQVHTIEVSERVIDKLDRLLDPSVFNRLEIIYAVLNRYRLYMSYTNDCLSCDDTYAVHNLDNTLEMYANPINSHVSSFCSLFPDLERLFGSVGSAAHIGVRDLMRYRLVIANPPYIDAVMTDMAKILERTIKECVKHNNHMTLIITVPDWRHTGVYECWKILERYITDLQVYDKDYEYVDKMTDTRVAASQYGTLIITINTSHIECT